ncbi:MAG: choice-of-anchor Q domain-containing protein, partial [Bacteroidota bacterium]
TNDTVIVANSILWNSLPTNFGPGITIQEITNDNGAVTPKLIVSHTDITGNWPGAGNKSINPGFVNPNPSNLDLRLPPTSPLIDAGINTPLSGLVDLAQESRISGTSVDMGAYELQDPNVSIIFENVELFRIINKLDYFKIMEVEDKDLIRWPDLLDGLNLAAMPNREVGSIMYMLEGEVSLERIANEAPWGMFSERDRPYLPAGVYELTATAFESPDGEQMLGSPYTISFEVEEEKMQEILIAPNPNNGIFSLQFPEDWKGQTTLGLMDLMGNVLWRDVLNDPRSEYKVLLPREIEGTLILSVQAGERIETIRLVVHR